MWNNFCDRVKLLISCSWAISIDSSILVKMSAPRFFFFMGHNFYITPRLQRFLLSFLLSAHWLLHWLHEELSLVIMEWLVFQLYANMFVERIESRGLTLQYLCRTVQSYNLDLEEVEPIVLYLSPVYDTTFVFRRL